MKNNNSSSSLDFSYYEKSEDNEKKIEVHAKGFPAVIASQKFSTVLGTCFCQLKSKSILRNQMWLCNLVRYGEIILNLILVLVDLSKYIYYMEVIFGFNKVRFVWITKPI